MDESLTDRITSVRFTAVRRDAYDMDEVDRFLDELAAAVRAREPIGGLVSRARFTPARFRAGYDMAEVDVFLDDVVHAAAGTGEALAPSVAPRPAEARTPLPNVIDEIQSPLRRLFGRRKR